MAGKPRKVHYPTTQQAELTTSLATIYTVTAGRTALQITIIVCNFTATDRGYDLKVRPTGDATANKHFWRGSNTSGAGFGELGAGHTEIWRLHVRPGESWVIESEASAANAIAMTISAAEMENESS